MLKNNDYYNKLFKEKNPHLVGLLDSKMRDEVSKITKYFFISLMPYIRTLQNEFLNNKEIIINNIKFNFISEDDENIIFTFEPGVSEPLLFSLSKIEDKFFIYKYSEEKSEDLIKLKSDIRKINNSDEFEPIFYSSDYNFYMDDTKFDDLEETLNLLKKNIYHNCVYTYNYKDNISYNNSENITDTDIISNLIDLKVLYKLKPVDNYYKEDLSISLFDKMELSDELNLDLDIKNLKEINVIDTLLNKYEISDVNHFLLIEEYERLLNYTQINFFIDSYKEILDYLIQNNYTNKKNIFYDDHNTKMMGTNDLPENKLCFSFNKENSIYEPREVCVLIREDKDRNPIHLDIYYSYDDRDDWDSYGENVDFDTNIYNKEDVASNLYNDCLILGNNVNRFTSEGLFNLFKEGKDCPEQRVLSYNIKDNKKLVFNSLMGQNALSLLHNSFCILDIINEYKDIKP